MLYRSCTNSGFHAAVDGPIVRCRTATAHAGDKNVRLTCEVRARPGLTALFWIIDLNGTAVTEGVVIDEYWSLNMVSDRSTLNKPIVLRFCTLPFLCYRFIILINFWCLVIVHTRSIVYWAHSRRTYFSP